jgi:hypothetical protein
MKLEVFILIQEGKKPIIYTNAKEAYTFAAGTDWTIYPTTFTLSGSELAGYLFKLIRLIDP